MEKLPPLNGAHRLALAIPNHGWLHDHRFLGRAVLPGVCALDHLARVVAQSSADAEVTALDTVRFDKLLPLPPPASRFVDALVEFAPSPKCGIAASLLTRHAAARSGMRRLKVHARALFGTAKDAAQDTPPTPWRPPSPGGGFQVPAERLYAEMVPFGAAFRNVASAVALWPEGARAVVSGGPLETAANTILGSPFPLDAAFHAVCAWAQRYHGVVAFPVAMARRRVWLPTRAGEHYQAVVRYREAKGRGLCFDLQLCDGAGRLCEMVQGLVMQDVSNGRLLPPAWVRAGEAPTGRRC